MAKLPNAPLQEVVFELRWELQVDVSNSREFDENFELALGKFQESVSESFPVYRRKAINSDSVPYQIAHQFWSKDRTWPVLQIGPGILTVNETDVNYDWKETFFPLIKSAVRWLKKAYDGRQKFILANLRYIDAISIGDASDDSPNDFIAQNLKIGVVNDFNTPGVLKHISVNQFFELEDGSQLELVVTTGKDHEQDPALIWQTAVSMRATFDEGNLFTWVERAHSESSKLFQAQTKGHLYDSFR